MQDWGKHNGWEHFEDDFSKANAGDKFDGWQVPSRSRGVRAAPLWRFATVLMSEILRLCASVCEGVVRARAHDT